MDARKTLIAAIEAWFGQVPEDIFWSVSIVFTRAGFRSSPRASPRP